MNTKAPTPRSVPTLYRIRMLQVSLAVDGYRWTPEKRDSVIREIASLKALRGFPSA